MPRCIFNGYRYFVGTRGTAPSSAGTSKRSLLVATRVLIAGGGVAALEAALALRELGVPARARARRQQKERVALPPNGDSPATGTLVQISKLRGLLRFSFQPFPGALLVASAFSTP